MLNTRSGNADGIHFLESVLTNCTSIDLTCKDDKRNAVSISRGNSVMAFVAPGPLVTRATPTLLLERE